MLGRKTKTKPESAVKCEFVISPEKFRINFDIPSDPDQLQAMAESVVFFIFNLTEDNTTLMNMMLGALIASSHSEEQKDFVSHVNNTIFEMNAAKKLASRDDAIICPSRMFNSGGDHDD